MKSSISFFAIFLLVLFASGSVNAQQESYIYCTDDVGVVKEGFLPTESVYAIAQFYLYTYSCSSVGEVCGGNVDLYTVFREGWTGDVGQILFDAGAGIESVTVSDTCRDTDDSPQCKVVMPVTLIWEAETVPGEYVFVIDIDQDGLLDQGDLFVEFSVIVKTPADYVKDIIDYIADMNPSEFDQPAHQNALINQLEALAATIEGLNPTAALARLNNIRKKVEKWVEDEEDKAAILAMIDRLIAYLESQETPGKGKGKANKAAVLASVSLPEKFQLLQNNPNPFNPSTTISYSVPIGNQKNVSLKVYDLRGRLVLTLVEGMIGVGTYTVYWDGMDDSGRQVSSGVYLYRLQAGEFAQTRKMVILK